MTYRLEAHTTADDPSRYRSDDEVEAWRRRDPVERLLQRLRADGAVDDGFLASVEEEGEALAGRMRDALYGAEDFDPLSMFDHVYAQRTPALDRQRAQLAAELAAEAG